MTILAAAVTLLVGLYAVEELLPPLFVPLVALAFVVAPLINWAAWYRLNEKRKLRARLSADPIVSLRVSTNIALLTAVGSTASALIGLFVVGRALNLFDAIPRELLLVLLAYPPLLLVIPASLWLRTVAQMERES